MTTSEATFAVEAALRRHCQRDRDSQLGMTLRVLRSSDGSRLTYWDGSLTTDHLLIQRRFVDGEIERCAIEAAQLDASLRVCLGYVVTDLQHRPEPSAWLLDPAGNVIDPARRLRDVTGYLGIELRHTEVASWTPSQPWSVSERDVHRLAV